MTVFRAIAGLKSCMFYAQAPLSGQISLPKPPLHHIRCAHHTSWQLRQSGTAASASRSPGILLFSPALLPPYCPPHLPNRRLPLHLDSRKLSRAPPRVRVVPSFAAASRHHPSAKSIFAKLRRVQDLWSSQAARLRSLRLCLAASATLKEYIAPTFPCHLHAGSLMSLAPQLLCGGKLCGPPSIQGAVSPALLCAGRFLW